MSIESFRARREAAEAGVQFEQGQSGREVTRQIGEKANQSVISKDAKARQLIDARKDMLDAQADFDLAKKREARKEMGRNLSMLNFALTGIISLGQNIYDTAVGKGEMGSNEQPDAYSTEARQKAMAKGAVDGEYKKGRAVVGGKEGVKFKDDPKDPKKFEVTYDVQVPTKEKRDELAAGIVAQVEKEGGTVVGGAEGIVFQPVDGSPGKFRPVYTVEKPDAAGDKSSEKVTGDPVEFKGDDLKTVPVKASYDKPEVKRAPEPERGFWGSLGHGTVKYVVMPVLSSVSDTMDAAKAAMSADEQYRNSHDQLQAAKLKRDAAFRKLQELQGALENF